MPRCWKDHGRELGEYQKDFGAKMGSFWEEKESRDLGKSLRDDEQ